MQHKTSCIFYGALSLLSFFVSATAFAEHSRLFQIKSGDVHFYGQVVNEACYVDLNSREQFIQMDGVQGSDFRHTGDRKGSWLFQIKLEGCDLLVSQNAAVLFIGEADKNASNVFQIESSAGSAKGVGISLFDSEGKQIVPGRVTTSKVFLQDGKPVLNYISRYQATSQTVKSGNINANIGFNVFYQ